MKVKARQPDILFTRDGQPMPPPIPAPPGASDVHAVFDPNTGDIVSFYWTQRGDPFGSPIPVPPGANDLAFGFDEFDELPPPKTAPPGTNDFEFVWRGGRIVEAWWTRDGVRIEPMPLSEDEHAVHVVPSTVPESQ